MSSSRNHAKRSHRSEQRKGSAFRAASARSYYKQSTTAVRRSIFSRISRFFTRKPPAVKQPTTKQTTNNDNI